VSLESVNNGGGNQGMVDPAVLLTRECPVRSGYPTGDRRNVDARPSASFKAIPTYVSRTEILCTFPQWGQSTFTVVDQHARRLSGSVSIPVDACWCVSGQKNCNVPIAVPPWRLGEQRATAVDCSQSRNFLPGDRFA
jgi:hypothetical protein